MYEASTGNTLIFLRLIMIVIQAVPNINIGVTSYLSSGTVLRIYDCISNMEICPVKSWNQQTLA